MMGYIPTRLTNLEHDLSVINLYFTLDTKKYWLHEPVEKFEYLGKEYVWNPDCIFVHQKKVYICELQLTPISESRWKRKWEAYNLYFNKGFFKTAAYQKWAGKIILPQFIAITPQKPDAVKSGFQVEGRELLVVKSL